MYCPHCLEELDELIYEAQYTEWGSEVGTADLEGDIIDTEDHIYGDSETNEIEYSCPHCCESLSIDELLEELPDGEEEIKQKIKDKKYCFKSLII
ncbi:MAG TPA: hypothetical protein PKN54_00770 [Candidatus Cloacimonas acidaminovorans]|nr:hypothetical protein [Candidatus Cloacimonas acidaminovorans]